MNDFNHPQTGWTMCQEGCETWHEATFKGRNQWDQVIYTVVCGGYEDRYTDEVVVFEQPDVLEPEPEPVQLDLTPRAEPERPSFPDSSEGAMKTIQYALALEWRSVVLNSLLSGDTRLVPDPEVKGVWGVLDAEGAARMVLYPLEADFEVDTEWFAKVNA